MMKTDNPQAPTGAGPMLPAVPRPPILQPKPFDFQALLDMLRGDADTVKVNYYKYLANAAQQTLRADRSRGPRALKIAFAFAVLDMPGAGIDTVLNAVKNDFAKLVELAAFEDALMERVKPTDGKYVRAGALAVTIAMSLSDVEEKRLLAQTAAKIFTTLAGFKEKDRQALIELLPYGLLSVEVYPLTDILVLPTTLTSLQNQTTQQLQNIAKSLLAIVNNGLRADGQLTLKIYNDYTEKLREDFIVRYPCPQLTQLLFSDGQEYDYLVLTEQDISSRDLVFALLNAYSNNRGLVIFPYRDKEYLTLPPLNQAGMYPKWYEETNISLSFSTENDEFVEEMMTLGDRTFDSSMTEDIGFVGYRRLPICAITPPFNPKTNAYIMNNIFTYGYGREVDEGTLDMVED